MATTDHSRKYDLVLVGATGYTGTLTAEHIALHLPTNLRWAIAARSATKLEALAARLKELNPDRLQPAIEVATPDDKVQFHALIADAKVCLSVVLYSRIGEAVIEACIENGTDYVDCAGGPAEIKGWIDNYHEKAQAAGVILIHCCGIFSAPQDLLAFLAARRLAEAYSETTKEVIVSGSEIPPDLSGGSVESIMHKASMDPRVVREVEEPWAISPVRGTQTSAPANIFGIRTDPRLGVMAACSVGSVQNRSLVHRTWGLLQGTSAAAAAAAYGYGPNFQYNEYQSVPSALAGALKVLAARLVQAALGLAFLRNLARRYLPAPGEGPAPEAAKHYSVRIEAVAVADGPSRPAHRAYAGFAYPEGPYPATALFLAHAGASLLYHRRLLGQLTGGCLTPAFLGDDLARRVQAAGATIETSLFIFSSKTSTFVVGTQRREFLVHKSAFTKLSDHFDRLMNSSSSEANAKRILLDDVDATVFEALCKFAYGRDYSAPASNVVSQPLPEGAEDLTMSLEARRAKKILASNDENDLRHMSVYNLVSSFLDASYRRPSPGVEFRLPGPGTQQSYLNRLLHFAKVYLSAGD
ncbi:Saccharopine dehydrogenase-domain-containing protein [Biscogniauxia mediterranea]|nr:Saccharopine dehydrogenase-domain-containing protein [Biscogniauxia mediterranea]